MSTITIMVAANETIKIRLVSIHFDIFDFECKGTTRQRNGCLTDGKRCLKSGICVISAVLPAYIAFCDIGHDSAKLKLVSLCSRYFPIFTTRHAVGIAEKAGKGGATGDA